MSMDVIKFDGSQINSKADFHQIIAESWILAPIMAVTSMHFGIC